MRQRLCSFHYSGRPPEFVGQFYCKGCLVCEKKLREGKTTADAPNPDSQRRGIIYARQPVAKATLLKWRSQLAGIKTGEET